MRPWGHWQDAAGSGGGKPGTPLNVLPCTGQPPRLRTVRPQVPGVPRLGIPVCSPSHHPLLPGPLTVALLEGGCFCASSLPLISVFCLADRSFRNTHAILNPVSEPLSHLQQSRFLPESVIRVPLFLPLLSHLCWPSGSAWEVPLPKCSMANSLPTKFPPQSSLLWEPCFPVCAVHTPASAGVFFSFMCVLCFPSVCPPSPEAACDQSVPTTVSRVQSLAGPQCSESCL